MSSWRGSLLSTGTNIILHLQNVLHYLLVQRVEHFCSVYIKMCLMYYWKDSGSLTLAFSLGIKELYEHDVLEVRDF